MADSLHIEIQPNTLAAVQTMAAERHLEFNAVMDELLQRGLSSLREEQFFEERMRRAGNVSHEQVLEILSRAGRDNPPDPGDEIPEDLKDWVEARRAARRP
jgi:hypothetical protein